MPQTRRRDGGLPCRERAFLREGGPDAPRSLLPPVPSSPVAAASARCWAGAQTPLPGARRPPPARRRGQAAGSHLSAPGTPSERPSPASRLIKGMTPLPSLRGSEEKAGAPRGSWPRGRGEAVFSFLPTATLYSAPPFLPLLFLAAGAGQGLAAPASARRPGTLAWPGSAQKPFEAGGREGCRRPSWGTRVASVRVFV